MSAIGAKKRGMLAVSTKKPLKNVNVAPCIYVRDVI